MFASLLLVLVGRLAVSDCTQWNLNNSKTLKFPTLQKVLQNLLNKLNIFVVKCNIAQKYNQALVLASLIFH